MNPSTAKARALVDEWIRAGLTDAVACPGSRNAPLLLALHEADRTGALRLHVRLDERGAGFLAVGLAARSGRVVPVVVTSGTAVANLHPAVLEASHAGVPLLVVSADRPLELVATGANQTIEQVGLFGPAVRAGLVLGPDDDRPGAPALWRSTAARALDRAAGTTTGDPGPVQLDVPLREPLVPGGAPGSGRPGALDAASCAGRPDGAPWTRVPRRGATLPPLAPEPGLRTIVVAGHGGGRVPASATLPDGVPVLAEPSAPVWSDPGGGRVLPAGPRVLGVALDGDRPDLRPEQVVLLGRPTLHRSVSRLLADPAVRVLAVPALAPDGRPRPGWTDVAGGVDELGGLPPDPASWAPDPSFARAWADAAALADRGTAAAPAPGAPVTGAALAAATVAALPAGSLLVLGSSNPVRDVALHAHPRPDVRVLAGRGVSGIDGTVSTAVGAALAHDGPTYALLGDLTFLHDAGGLALGAHEPAPELVVVVADDSGGGIFTVLEQGAAEYAGAFERVFATPQRVDLAALCAAYGVAHRRVADLADLVGALTPTGVPGLRVVQVPVDRAGRREASRRADEQLREALITAR